jgi:hypothetical protein
VAAFTELAGEQEAIFFLCLTLDTAVAHDGNEGPYYTGVETASEEQEEIVASCPPAKQAPQVSYAAASRVE